jgi:hypothetical protein
MQFHVVVENQQIFLDKHVASIFRHKERDKQKTSMKPEASCNAEDGGNIFIRNVYELSTYYTAFYPTIQNSSVMCVSFCHLFYGYINIWNGRMNGE